jgi:NADH dehydrogenase FAD-containing subunit
MAGTGQAAAPHRIVVVGGGAAGLELVTRLGNTLGKSGKARVTLAEKARTHLWKPLLHAVAAGSLDRARHELHDLAQAAHQQVPHMIGQISRRLAGQPLTPFVYRDFGSLVSLGRDSTVGSLMGFLVGRSMFIEGYFARLMYRSPYKMHQSALHGHAPVLWRTPAGLLTSRMEPGVKLH